MSYMVLLNNRTPFSAEDFVFPDQEGQEIVLVVLSATFQGLNATSPLELADQQMPVRSTDEYNGNSELSSIRYEADVALDKPFVDVLINGSAYAPNQRPSAIVPIKIAVGDVRKELIVSGDRFWRTGPLGISPSSPKPFLTMPIVYERAFGGVDRSSADPKDHAVEQRNLAGLGFRGAVSYDATIHTEVPNIEYPHFRQTRRSDTPKPAGLGVIARGWQQRICFAGTYDKQWLEEQWPFLPLDFDSRHYQAAPLDQQSNTVQGGEVVSLLNLTRDGIWSFHLPILNVPVRLHYDNRREKLCVRLDTVLIEPDFYRVTLTCRVTIKTQRNNGMLREVILGRVSPGWLRASKKGKKYINYIGNHGKLLTGSN